MYVSLAEIRARAPKRREQVRRLHKGGRKGGLNQLQIAAKLGITQARVSQILKQIRAEEKPKMRPRGRFAAEARAP
jgi:DNA-directed RNA polymerase specialized sigma subunit